MTRVLITGAGAQLAAALSAEFEGCAEVHAARRSDLDITDADSVRRAMDRVRPDVILNCASYNFVDAAEDEPRMALDVNAFGVRLLARAASDAGAALVHFSTDFVFAGTASTPYTEDDAANPQSTYGASKLLGEWFALESPKGYVLRVASLFGGMPAKSSVDRIVDAIIAGGEARVFSDRVASPSYVFDVAAATRAVLERGRPGLYHCVGTGHCTWLELGTEAARLLGKQDARLIPILAADLRLRAARPQYAALSNAKLAAITPIPTWRDALARYIASKNLPH